MEVTKPNATISQCEKMKRSPNLSRLGGGTKPNATISQCEKMRRSPNLSRLGGGHETQRHHLSVRKNEAIAQFE
ncbi:hypothetical protein [Limnospira maxima]|uniref:hypothetical protein n=1 Tax=Limnospira maxima TaxID=129910 RepID=UPI000D3B446A|nr:hypothetical protein [Limnospira maxima]